MLILTLACLLCGLTAAQAAPRPPSLHLSPPHLAAPPAPPPARWSLLTELDFRHVTPEQGLPNEIATALAEDREGFLWVGTLGGLARWDGYRFRVYKSDPRVPEHSRKSKCTYL